MPHHWHDHHYVEEPPRLDRMRRAFLLLLFIACMAAFSLIFWAILETLAG
jgi:hypothetical protein